MVWPTRKGPKTAKQVGLMAGHRSGLEDQVAGQLLSHGIQCEYESVTIQYAVEETRKYTPDFPLPNGIIIETKGRFVTADRKKHLLVKRQYPGLDIRFVFSNPNQRISKQSKTTYAMWCDHKGFKYAKGFIPVEWLSERTNHQSLEIIEDILKGDR